MNIFNTTFVTQNGTLLLKITQNNIWLQNMSPAQIKFIGSAGGLNNSHISHNCSEPTTEWHLKAWHSMDSIWLYKVSPHCWYHPYLLNSSPTINTDVDNNVRIRASVGARACVNSVCMTGMLADSHRSDLRLGGTETQGCLLIVANRKYKDYVYRKMLVQEYLKK